MVASEDGQLVAPVRSETYSTKVAKMIALRLDDAVHHEDVGNTTKY